MAGFAKSFILLAAALLTGCGAAGGAPSPEAGSPAAASGPVHFVQEVRPSTDGKEALNRGVLTLDGAGCLRLGESGPVLVWPAEAVLDLTQPGVVRILDGRGGPAVRVGDGVALGGGSFPGDGRPTLSRPLGPCAGELWDVDSFEPLAGFHARHPHLAGPPQAAPVPPAA